ncbi:hypothetical protein ILYODFUR_023173 [Ilyodon furcidens]|uniref:Uncharacterized protein n=1 Tax=Ilyodon furcidens TaxID=33524 RepID=A0ABV0SZD7_9TELE
MSLLRTPSKVGNHLNIQQLGPNEAADLCAVIHLTAELRNGMVRPADQATNPAHSDLTQDVPDHRPGRGGSILSRDTQTPLTPDTSFSSSGGSLGQPRDI